MNVEKVAKKLGKSPHTIRLGLQRGIFPFGTAFKVTEDSSRWTYVIYPKKVKEYLGK